MCVRYLSLAYLYYCCSCCCHDIDADADVGSETFCMMLQHTATHCNTLQHTAAHCSTLLHTAPYYIILQHTATHCNTRQHTAAHCDTPQQHCSTLKYTEVYCSTLQQNATHCNTLQHADADGGSRRKLHNTATNRIMTRDEHSVTHCKTLQHTATHHTWQFPLKTIHPWNQTNRQTQIPRYLAVQIQIVILFSFECVPRRLRFSIWSISGM